MRTFINPAVLNPGMRWGSIAAILLVLLAGCITIQVPDKTDEEPQAPGPVPAPAEPAEAQAQPSPEDAEPQAQGPEPPAPSPEPVAEEQREPPAPTAASIQGFYDLYLTEVKNYKFTYNSDVYKVKGRFVRIELFRVLQNIYNAPYIDVIYLDRERRMAVGVCEGRDIQIKKQCSMRDTLDKQFAVPYIQFAITFPDDWLKEFLNLYSAPAETPRLPTERLTVHLKHTTQTRTTDLYIDPSSGLPLVVIDNSKEYHYQGLSRNTVTETFPIENLS
jgi:hypothetical protein